jgi:hypothetical protein
MTRYSDSQPCLGPTQREVVNRAKNILRRSGWLNVNITNLPSESALEIMPEVQLGAVVRILVAETFNDGA